MPTIVAAMRVHGIGPVFGPGTFCAFSANVCAMCGAVQSLARHPGSAGIESGNKSRLFSQAPIRPWLVRAQLLLSE